MTDNAAAWPFPERPEDEILLQKESQVYFTKHQRDQMRNNKNSFIPKYNVAARIDTKELTQWTDKNKEVNLSTANVTGNLEALKKANEEEHYGPDYVIETDPNGKCMQDPGAKADAGKNRVWLFMAGFSRALEEVSKVTSIGATKYTPNGWAFVPNGSERYMDAFGRHMLKLGAGETFDNAVGGTGCYHKAQMIWNLLASLELDLRNESS